MDSVLKQLCTFYATGGESGCYEQGTKTRGTSCDCELSRAVKVTIAARDKWWITKAFSLLDELTPTGYSTEDAFTIRKFIEQLKISLQSSAALTNLMGKFPDLPDVREVGQ